MARELRVDGGVGPASEVATSVAAQPIAVASTSSGRPLVAWLSVDGHHYATVRAPGRAFAPRRRLSSRRVFYAAGQEAEFVYVVAAADRRGGAVVACTIPAPPPARGK